MEFVWVSASVLLLKELRHKFVHVEEFSSSSVCNQCQSFPSFIILVPLWCIIAFLGFFYLVKYYLRVLFNFVRGQNNSKKRQRSYVMVNESCLNFSISLFVIRVNLLHP